MRRVGYSMFLVATMVLALGLPVEKGKAATISETEKEQVVEIVPAYESTVNVSHSLSISGNMANLVVNVSAPSSKKVTIKMILQRKDGTSWVKVQKWTKEGMGRQILTKSMAVTKGKKYRMKYTVTVGSETISGKTATKTA